MTETTSTTAHVEIPADEHVEGISGELHEIHLQPHIPGVASDTIFHIGSFPVTNSFLASFIVMLVLVGFGITIRASLKKIPGKLQSFFEVIIEQISSLCDQITNDHNLSRKIAPVAITLFLFILFNNWFGLLPGVGSIGMIAMHDGHQTLVPYLRGGTADINTTLALALFTVIASNVFGMITIGVFNVLNKYINVGALKSMVKNFRKDPTQIIVAPITFFVGVLEIIGEVAKVASLSFRLFGNVFAGEVLLASMAALLAFAVPIPFLFLEVMVGVIQAFIFSTLTVVYFTLAAQMHDHEESHEHDVEHAQLHT